MNLTREERNAVSRILGDEIDKLHAAARIAEHHYGDSVALSLRNEANMVASARKRILRDER